MKFTQLSHAILADKMARAFDGKTDLAGEPYIFHLVRVANQAQKWCGQDGCIVGLIHDAIEDLAMTVNELRDMGVSDANILRCQALTRKKNMPYTEYIDSIVRYAAENKDLVVLYVKLSDLLDNMNLGRLNRILERDLVRFEKYANAVSRIRQAVQDLGGDFETQAEAALDTGIITDHFALVPVLDIVTAKKAETLTRNWFDDALALPGLNDEDPEITYKKINLSANRDDPEFEMLVVRWPQADLFVCLVTSEMISHYGLNGEYHAVWRRLKHGFKNSQRKAASVQKGSVQLIFDERHIYDDYGNDVLRKRLDFRVNRSGVTCDVFRYPTAEEEAA